MTQGLLALMAVAVAGSLALPSPSTAAAAVPYAGDGVAIVYPSPDEKLMLYRWPEVGFLREVTPAAMPKLPIDADSGVPLAVYRREGEWLQVPYDEAGRSGW